mgnify:CR=1 FL=1
MKRNFLPEIKKRCVLRIVDDDPDIRKSLSFLLRANGWNAKAYEKCAAFIADDTPSVPGCLILDVRMPDKSGLEIQQLLNERNYQIPIVFLTGHGDIEMAVHAMQLGAVDFLQKPVDSTKLLELIEKYCLLSAKKASPLLYLSSPITLFPSKGRGLVLTSIKKTKRDKAGQSKGIYLNFLF